MLESFTILSKAIEGTQRTSAQARAEIYEIARAALKKAEPGRMGTGDQAEQECAALERDLTGRSSIAQNDEGRRLILPRDTSRLAIFGRWSREAMSRRARAEFELN
jgi:hypothetical protein